MTLLPDVPDAYRTAAVAIQCELIAASFQRLTGNTLVDGSTGDVVAALWWAGQAIVAHGTGDDPLFFFANFRALDAFDADLAAFVGMPSRLSAEAPARAERQSLLDQVTRHGFIDNYAGMRISATGRRFRIENAIVWNLVVADGKAHGQAATFAV